MLKSFVVMNKANVKKQAQLWATYLPYVTPYYAVKSNNDQQLLRWITEVFEPHNINAGFDCASITEMEQVRKVTKKAPIIYAQPCKTDKDLNESKRHGVRTTVVDSPEEMQKLRNSGWKGDTMIRLAVPDNKSKQPFSKKFGAPIQWVPQIFELSQAYKIPIRGLSFHVGSECENPDQFAKALQMCRLVFDIAVESKINNMDLIDIGGGFLHTNVNLAGIASSIESARTKLFPNNLTPANKPIEWIAEPGRFLSATSQTLYTPIIGRKRAMPSTDLEYRYTVNESIYGYFSNIPFDSQKPEFSVVHQTPIPATQTLHKSIIFGRTCDGADIINPQINLPLLKEGDWLEVDNMGAYTNVTASEFNGFPKPDMIYLD